MKEYLPFWHASYEPFESVAKALEGMEEVHSRNFLFGGESIFDFGENIHYPLMNMMALFAHHKGGDEVFLKTTDLCLKHWNENEVLVKPVQMLAQALGYADFADFFQDFVLSLISRPPQAQAWRTKHWIGRRLDLIPEWCIIRLSIAHHSLFQKPSGFRLKDCFPVCSF